MFHTATPDQIKNGEVTDLYFVRSIEVLRAKGLHKQVTMEVRATSLPADYRWSILAGVEEAARLLEGLPVHVEARPEGTLFHAGEPVLTLTGEYTSFGLYETALLGFLSHGSGIATRAARCRLAAGPRTLLSFGARRMHPALAPMIDRNAFLGGCDGFSTIITEALTDQPASGTMPHAYILVVGDAAEAYRLFDEVQPPDIPRICLVDTFEDEKFGALTAAHTLGDHLSGVRLDTPGSRRGDMAQLLREVRWELDTRGYEKVKIFLSGGLDEETILEANPFCDGYGVGTAISNAPVINFSADIVEVDGRPLAKRGKESGQKQVMRCSSCHLREVVPLARATQTACPCGGKREPLLRPLIDGGRIVAPLSPVSEIRQYVLDQLQAESAKL